MFVYIPAVNIGGDKPTLHHYHDTVPYLALNEMVYVESWVARQPGYLNISRENIGKPGKKVFFFMPLIDIFLNLIRFFLSTRLATLVQSWWYCGTRPTKSTCYVVFYLK